MYRIVLSCSGVPPSSGPSAAIDIEAEFKAHRQWHSNVRCKWDGSRLLLEAENAFDQSGLALQDEFSDCLSAYIAGEFDGELQVESVTQL